MNIAILFATNSKTRLLMGIECIIKHICIKRSVISLGKYIKTKIIVIFNFSIFFRILLGHTALLFFAFQIFTKSTQAIKPGNSKNSWMCLIFTYHLDYHTETSVLSSCDMVVIYYVSDTRLSIELLTHLHPLLR